MPNDVNGISSAYKDILHCNVQGVLFLVWIYRFVFELRADLLQLKIGKGSMDLLGELLYLILLVRLNCL